LSKAFRGQRRAQVRTCLPSWRLRNSPMGDDLDKRIAKAQAELDAQKRPKLATDGPGMGLGFRMAAEFVAPVLVGAGLGWGGDLIFHATPWGLVGFLLLGFVTGVWNVARTAMTASKSAGDKDKG